jgi:hypothetical protein
VIEAAYNDRRGVTAAFNLNILVRINRELGADFDIEQFAHRAFYNAAPGRIEMRLISRRDQVVRIGRVSFLFVAGESIHTENSYKYRLPALNDLADAGGFALERVWTDERQYFSVAYLTPRHSGNDRVLPGSGTDDDGAVARSALMTSCESKTGRWQDKSRFAVNLQRSGK